MDALGQALPIKSLGAGRALSDDNLGVDRTSCWQILQDCTDHFWEVASQWFGATAGELDLVTVTQHDAAETIPFRFQLYEIPGDQVFDLCPGHGLGQHGRDRERDGQVHKGILNLRRCVCAINPARYPKESVHGR